jgi:hypothetical protein
MFSFRLTTILLLAAISSLTLLSCEKEVNLSLTSGATQLVVNGQIETELPPFVILTHSIGYFSKVDLQTLQNSFIHDAVVKVNDGTREVTLREYSFDTSSGSGDARFYFYSLDANDPTALDFKGENGKTYLLTITSEGRTYTSATKIPFPKAVDSITAVAPQSPPPKAPTAMQLIVYYSDPDTSGNAVRYFTKRNSEPYYPGPNSVFDDAVVNGGRNAQYPLQAGSARSNVDFTDSTGYVFKGDTVTLKWAAIDRGVFNFYISYEYAIGTVGNPFASPINVQTNVTNGALGIWAGYGSTYTTIVVPK